MRLATVVVTVLLALVAAASGVPKLARAAATVDEAVRLGVPQAIYPVIGGLELLAALGLLAGLAIAPVGAASAGGLALLMGGAVLAHLRVQDPPAALIPAAAVGAAAAVALVLRLASA